MRSPSRRPKRPLMISRTTRSPTSSNGWASRLKTSGCSSKGVRASRAHARRRPRRASPRSRHAHSRSSYERSADTVSSRGSSMPCGRP